MNFPPILFYDSRFSKIFTKNPTQNSASLFSYQNLYKKLLKFENKDKDFQSNVINWLKTLTKIQLVKYFSFNNQWLIDILHEMILISNNNPDQKYNFNASIKSKDVILSFFNLLNQETLELYKPIYTEYFSMSDTSGYINLSKKTEEEKLQKRFIDNIRYLTIPTNIQNSNNNNNNKEKNKEKYFFEYNNVVTLSYDYLSNIDIVIDNMLIISHNELFKHPIEIETQYCELGKYYYNARLSKWLSPQFTLAELLCCYFEQSILINYQYYLLYKEEINFLHYEKLDELLDNIFQILEFIGNANEKKVEIFQSIKKDEIRKFINDNQYIRKIMSEKKRRDDYIRIYDIGNFADRKKHTIKEIIDSTMLTLENMFIKSDKNFVFLLTFIKDSYVFHEEDFIIKNAFEKINNFWKSKIAEDLLQELTSNDTTKKKRRKKKKKNNEKNEENKNYCIINNENIENEVKINIINNENFGNIQNNEIKENNIKEDYLNEQINEKHTDEIILNNEKQLNEREDIIISTKTDIPENINENKMDEFNEHNTKDNNKIQKEEKNNNEIIVKKDEEESKEELNDEVENENSNKKKKEKNFFLYPVVKNHKKKKNKNKKKEKKKNNNNILNEKENADKTDNNQEIFENDKLSGFTFQRKNSNNEKSEENNKNDYFSKHKNKMNIRNKFNNINKDISIQFENNNNNFIQSNNINQSNLKSEQKEFSELDHNHSGNNGYFNQNKIENNHSRSNKNNKSFLEGSNFPSFTSFDFKSKKKGRNYRKKQSDDITEYSFITNNIFDLSNEIIENTKKVDENKKLLKKFREKYVNEISEKIKIILHNENIEFLSSGYGSNISGLAIENSDYDIMVKIKQNKNNINYINKVIDIVYYKLKASDLKYITEIKPIYTASVPVIKIECDLSNDDNFNEINDLVSKGNLNYNDIIKLFFDITFFEVENEKEKIPSELMIDYIKEKLKLFPKIIDIIYIMKRFLFNKNLNKSYQGGISSYSLFLLILAFLKFFKNKNNSDILIGSLLIEFLKYYSNFNFYNYAIRPNSDKENEIFIINDKNTINIIDPITGINVAKSTFKINEINNAFKEGYNIILGNLYKINEGENNKKIIDNLLAI